jgi:D-arabinose 1-dehydrogenase-like Zn-dependent alcohol dehydrogenase
MTGENEQCRQAQGCTITSKKDPKQTMKAVAWYGNKDIRIIERSRPLVTDPHDVILKVTSTAICGSDLVCFRSCWIFP